MTEPPDAEPHVRWCERSAAKAASYSIVVIDWAELVKKEDGTDGLKPEYDTDGLHPSVVGGKAMAEYLLERYAFEMEK